MDKCPQAALCDLLIGRMFRLRAEGLLEEAVKHHGMMSDALFESAVHAEWIAVRAEWGQIAWGGRINRCGYQIKHS